MSRILKRPMFRIGGPANDGIMSMAAPRKQYAEGGDIEKRFQRNRDLLRSAVGEGRSQDDRLSELLISGGLNLLSARPSGNIFSTAAGAFKEPTSQYLKSAQDERNFGRQLDLGAATTAITSADAAELAALKLKGESNFQKDYSPDRMYYEAYTKYTDPKSKDTFKKDITTDYPESFASFIAYIQPSSKKLGIDITGVVPNRISGNTREFQYEEMIAGGTYFDPRTKNLYQRDPEKNIVTEINPFNGKKIRDIPLK